MSFSKLKTRPLGNCIERETIHSILKTSEARLRSEVWCSLPQSWGLKQFFLCPTLVTKRRKDIFLYFFTELKTYYLSYSISKLFKFYITWIFGGCMLKIFGGRFVSTSSTARKTIKTVLMKLKVEKCLKWLVPSRLYFVKES